MFTEKDFQKNPGLIKAFTGLPEEVFWQLIADLQAKLPEYERERLARPDRQRAVGFLPFVGNQAGCDRACDRSGWPGFSYLIPLPRLVTGELTIACPPSTPISEAILPFEWMRTTSSSV